VDKRYNKKQRRGQPQLAKAQRKRPSPLTKKNEGYTTTQHETFSHASENKIKESPLPMREEPFHHEERAPILFVNRICRKEKRPLSSTERKDKRSPSANASHQLQGGGDRG